MASRYFPDCIHHGEYGQTECKSDARKTYIVTCYYCATATDKDQDKRSDKLCTIFCKVIFLSIPP
jgi:hypothetical protein